MTPGRALWLLAWVGLAACGGATRQARVPAVPSDPPRAVAKARATLAEEGPSAERYLDLAAARAADGDAAGAEADLRRAAALGEGVVGRRVVAARLAAARGDFESAALHYEEVALRWPAAVDAVADAWGDALLAVAAARVAEGRSRDAAEVLEDLAERLPAVARRSRAERAEVALAMADRLVEAGDGEAALEAIAMARAAGAPADASALSEARALVLTGEAERGLALLSRWADEGAPAEQRRLVAARFLSRRAGAEAALAAWERVVDRDAEGYVATAEAALGAGQSAQAAQAYREAAEAATGDARQAELLATGAAALADKGDRADALGLYEAAAAAAPREWSHLQAWLEALARFGAKADMGRVFSAALTRAADPAAMAERGVELFGRAGALEELTTALGAAAEAPGAPAALRLWLAEGLHRQKRLVARRNEVLEQYVAAAGDDPDALVAAGRAWWRFGEDRRALGLGRRAQRLAPNSVAPALLIADAERSAGHVAEEQAALGQAAAAGEPAAAALALGQRALELAQPAQAVPWLSRAVQSEDAGVRRAADRALAAAYQRSRPPRDLEAGVHLRRWLAAAPPDERAAALEEVLRATLNIPALVDLRLEALEGLSALNPQAGALADELAQLTLARRGPDAAVAIWRRHLEHAADPRGAALRIGALLLGRGHEAAALTFLEGADMAAIARPKLHRQLGDIYARRGETGRAEAHFRAFIDTATAAEDAREMAIFAAEMEKARRDALAEAAYGRLLQWRADDSDALRGLGAAKVRQGRVAEGREALDRYVASASSSQRRRNLEKVGEIYEGAGELALAAAAFQELTAEQGLPSAGLGMARVARVYQRMGDLEGLARSVDALVSTPRQPERRYHEAVGVLRAAGLHDAAVALLERGLEAHPRLELLLDDAVDLALDKGDAARAADYLVRKVQLRVATPEAWQKAAARLSQAGYAREALALLSRDEVPVAGAPEVQLERGRLLTLLGDYDAAEESFAAALLHARWPRDLLDKVDAAWRAAGQDERLRRFHARGAAVSPTRAEHSLALGRLWLGAGDLREAQQAFARYLSLQERGQWAVARAYVETGYADASWPHYLKAFEQPPSGTDEWSLSDAAQFMVEHGRAELLPDLARLELARAREPDRALRSVARALLEGGAVAEAARLLERANSQSPSRESVVLQGLMHLIAGDDAAAESVLGRGIDLAFESQATMLRAPGLDRSRLGNVALYDVVQALALRGRDDMALRLVRTATARYGEDAWRVAVEAQRLVAAGRIEEAMARLRTTTARLGDAPAEMLEGVVGRLESRGRLDLAAEVAGLASAARWNNGLGEAELRLRIRLGELAAAERVAARWVAQASQAAATDIAAVALEEDYRGMALRYAALGARPPASARTVDLLGVLSAAASDADGGEATPAHALLAEDAADQLGAWTARAQLAFRARRLPEARKALARALSLWPTSPELTRLGWLIAAQGGDAAAIDAAVREAGRGERPRLTVLDELVSVLDDAGRPELALRPAEALRDLEPGRHARYVRLVTLALRAGLDEQARAYGDQMLATCGRDPALVLALADLWVTWLQGAEARRILAGLEGLRGVQAATEARIVALAALAEGDSVAAMDAWERSIALSPDGGATRIAAAESLLSWRADPARALAFLSPLLTGPTPPPRALATAARAAWRAGQGEAARGFLGALIALYPASGGELPLLITEAVQAADTEGARMAADALVHRTGVPDGAALAASAAVAGLDVAEDPTAPRPAPARPPTFERTASAVEGLLAGAAEGASMAEDDVATRLAVIDEARGRPDLALRAYEAARATHPDNPARLNNFAYSTARLGGDLGRALVAVREALRRSGEPSAVVLDTEAWVLHLLGRHQEALQAIRHALATSAASPGASRAGSPEVLYHLGSIEAAAGDRAKAGAIWRDCARREPTGVYGARCLERWRESERR